LEVKKLWRARRTEDGGQRNEDGRQNTGDRRELAARSKEGGDILLRQGSGGQGGQMTEDRGRNLINDKCPILNVK
jgi:hypothetical protein